MKADRTWIFEGKYYLPGAEMPEGWTPPVIKNKNPGVFIYGPDGLMENTPEPALPPGISKIEPAKEESEHPKTLDSVKFEGADPAPKGKGK